MELERESKRAGAAFLITEIETSLTFAQLALQSGDNAEKRNRNRQNARKGYDNVIRLAARFNPSDSGKPEQDYQEKFLELKSALEQLGERL